MEKLDKEIAGLTEGRYHRGDSSSGDLISRSALLAEFPVNLESPMWHVTRVRAVINAADAVEAEPWNPVTNHQRIAKMSVPEMAKWLWSMKALCDCCEKQYICGVPDDEVTKGYCLKHVEKWLEQEVADA